MSYNIPLEELQISCGLPGAVASLEAGAGTNTASEDSCSEESLEFSITSSVRSCTLRARWISCSRVMRLIYVFKFYISF